MSTPDLIYFNGRGYAEVIRLVLAACEIEYREVEIASREEYLELMPNLTFGQVPVLKVGDKYMTQSGAIVRHYARLHNLYGKDEDERTRVDTCYEGTRDFLKPLTPVGVTFPFDEFVEHTQNVVNKYLPLFDQILLKNDNNDHLVGSSLTFADLGLLEALLYVEDYYGPHVYDAYKGISEFKSNMSKQKFYEKYIKQLRTPTHTPELIAHVRKVFAY